LSDAAPPRIELAGVWKAFGDNQVLRGVDLAVQRGESLVIIGGSGTGKSVTLKCILGIERPDRGEVRIDGRPLGRIDRRAYLRQTGMLFQGGALFDSLTVWQNVAFRLRHARRPLPRAAARELAVAKLARVGLGPETADLYPAELSGGMQKRVGLARAIATDPDIIFFDEPTAGLDPIMAGVINELIRALVREMGATAITITHDMRTVGTVADHVAMLHGGLVRWAGPVSAMQGAGDPYLDQFVQGRATGPIETVR
jgi:phospholipid/cholesterol/gamma-HCH transport system ATP-binding protein